MTSTTQLAPAWFNKSLNKIAACMAKLSSAVSEVSSIYVDAVDRDPLFRDYVRETMPETPSSFWRNIERVGRNQLDGRIMGGSIPYGNRLRYLSISEQRCAIDGGLTLLVREGHSMAVRIDSITADQAEQLFARDHIRSLPEQQAFLESKATELRIQSLPFQTPSVKVDKSFDGIFFDGKFVGKKELQKYIKELG